MLKKIWAFVLAAAVAVGYIGATGSMEVYAGENNIVASLNAGFNEAGNDRVSNTSGERSVDRLCRKCNRCPGRWCYI